MEEPQVNKNLQVKVSCLNWLLNRRSRWPMAIEFVVSKTILKTLWSCVVQLKGIVSISKTEVLQRFQSKTLKPRPWDEKVEAGDYNTCICEYNQERLNTHRKYPIFSAFIQKQGHLSYVPEEYTFLVGISIPTFVFTNSRWMTDATFNSLLLIGNVCFHDGVLLCNAIRTMFSLPIEHSVDYLTYP